MFLLSCIRKMVLLICLLNKLKYCMLNFSINNKTILGCIYKNKLRQYFTQAVFLIDKDKTKDMKYIFDLSIVNDKTIRRINKNYRKIDKVTDVISFAFNDGQIKTELLGEIFIDIYQAKRQNKKEWIKEMTLLFIHGILHLLGYDHDTKEKQKKMFAYQESILNQIKF